MGFLDDAKGKLGDAAEWVKDKAEHLGEQTQGAGQTLGEKAAEARNWVEGRIGGDGSPDGEQQAGAPAPLHGDAAPVARTSGGGEFASEWVDASADPDMGGPQAEQPADGEDASLDEPGPQNPL